MVARPRPRVSGRVRRWARSVGLRQRLVMIQVGLLLVSCVLVGFATEFALHRFLVDRLDQQLIASSDRFAASINYPADGDHDADDLSFDSVQGQAAGTLGAKVVAGQVSELDVIGQDVDRPEPTARDRAAIAAIAAVSAVTPPVTRHLPDLGDYRIVVTRDTSGDLLVTGLPENTVDDTINHLLLIEAVVFGLALLVVGVAGAVSVRLSLRPLNRVVHTARRVADLPLSTGAVALSDRVPVVAAGTEVGQVAVALNHMLDHVGSALSDRHASEQRLRRFIADASHELRTPVTVIRSHAEYAQRVAPALPGEVGTALDRIVAESDRMGHLVDDLLTLARIDSGRPLAREDVDLTRLVLDAVNDARTAGADHFWELQLPDEPVAIIADGHAIQQLLSNLLTNAHIHTPAGTHVTCAVQPAADRVRLTVSDDGPGIAPELQSIVFDRFVHGRRRDNAAAGTGLGLSIVAAIVAAHNGSVTLTSTPGNTRFDIDLAVTVEPGPARPDVRVTFPIAAPASTTGAVSCPRSPR